MEELGFSGGSMVKNLTANAGDAGSIPVQERSSGEGRGNPLQYSCLENPMDRGTWKAIVRRVTKSWTQLKQLSRHAHIYQFIKVLLDFGVRQMGF